MAWRAEQDRDSPVHRAQAAEESHPKHSQLSHSSCTGSVGEKGAAGSSPCAPWAVEHNPCAPPSPKGCALCTSPVPCNKKAGRGQFTTLSQEENNLPESLLPYKDIDPVICPKHSSSTHHGENSVFTNQAPPASLSEISTSKQAVSPRLNGSQSRQKH